MTLSLDHVVIAVYDLEKATADYRQLGFTPFFGGVHAGGKTHNALIVFQDGTYLELLAPTDAALLHKLDPNDRSSFLFLLAQGEGFVGYALHTAYLETEVARIQAAGISMSLRPPAGRARPDGQRLEWRSAFLENTMSPFLLQDLTARVLRVPDDPALTSQTNGAVGLSNITIPVTAINVASQHYEALLGRYMHRETDRITSVSLGTCDITLHQPDTHTEMLDHLQQRGEVPYVLTLRSTAETQQLDVSRAHHARIILESKGQD